MIPLGVLGSAHVPTTGVEFDPIGGVGWEHVYWAEGPAFTALGYSDGDGVATWPDEVGSVDFTQATSGNRPHYKAALAVMNGQPSVKPDGVDDYLLSSSFSLPSGTSVVYVGQIEYLWTTHWLLDASTSDYLSMRAPSGNRTVTISDFTSTLTSPTFSYPATACYLMTGVWNGASSVIELNGSQVASGNAGDGDLGTTAYMFTRRTLASWSPSPAAFFGFYTGDVRSDPGWADFESWVADHYGITIA